MSYRSGASRRNQFDSVPAPMLTLDVGATAYQVRQVHSVLSADARFTDGLIDLEVMIVMSEYFAHGARDLLNKQLGISQDYKDVGGCPRENCARAELSPSLRRSSAKHFSTFRPG